MKISGWVIVMAVLVTATVASHAGISGGGKQSAQDSAQLLLIGPVEAVDANASMAIVLGQKVLTGAADRLAVGDAVALGARCSGAANHGQRPDRVAECPQSVIGDPGRNPQRHGDVLGSAASPNLPGTSGPGPLARTPPALGESAAPLAGTKRPPTAWTSENPQDGNHPERQDGKDFIDDTSTHLLATLREKVTVYAGHYGFAIYGIKGTCRELADPVYP